MSRDTPNCSRKNNYQNNPYRNKLFNWENKNQNQTFSREVYKNKIACFILSGYGYKMKVKDDRCLRKILKT